ncbi:Clr5 domain-containing protein [Aspergillus pseudoustus]|uniref:Clr5 domain-containing protein n=1 Tax=Aspergillus pseudoustus TaxID=1810923 RepID=A0ABR4KQX4_9EURO
MMEGSVPSSSSLSTSTPTPTTSSSSPAAPSVFRPRRSEDWNKYRATIETLYRDDQLKLRDVKRIMERDHKFQAFVCYPISISEKQYKDRLAAWNIRKNIKAKEVNVMIRKQAKRAARGKQTVFRVAGQKVDTKRIARFQRRYQGSGPHWDPNELPGRPVEPHRESPEPATPSDMSYYTPEPDERATTLSPHPESHSQHFDNLDPIHDSEIDETKSLSATLSPTTTTATSTYPFHFEEMKYSVSEEGALTKFQKRLMQLEEKLDHDTANLFPIEDPSRHSTKSDNYFLS